jgi:hypothetical protein
MLVTHEEFHLAVNLHGHIDLASRAVNANTNQHEADESFE